MSTIKINITKTLRDPSTSWWLKHLYTSAMDRDIVDAINDVEILLAMLKQDYQEMMINHAG